MDDRTRKIVLIGVVAAVVFGVVGASLWGVSDETEELPAPEETTTDAELSAWSTGEGQPVDVTWSESEGPTATLSDQTVNLAPPDLTWSSEKRGSSTLLVGTHETTRLAWEFAPGNPSALLTAEATVPMERLRRPVELVLTLPAGELEAWDPGRGFHSVDSYRASGASSWIRWTSGDAVLTFRGWSGDALSVTKDANGVQVSLALWTPERHPEIVECLGELDATDVTLSSRGVVELRELPRLVAWPYPDAAEAMLLPLFLAPELHSDPQLQEAKSRNASDFVDRVTTLAYGHSSPSDPRYGNGGLLGHGLGGTVVAPDRFLKKKKVQQLATDLAPTSVDVAAGSPPPATSPYEVVFSREPSCQTLSSQQLRGLATPTDPDATTRATTAPSPFVTRLDVRTLDGRLDSVLAQGFSRAYAEQTLRERGVYTFASPLVATRNPLIGAAADALLEPEREGQWTVAPRLAGSLADVELWREEKPLGVASVENLLTYWDYSSRAALVWSENGAPAVSSTGDDAQVGYTIVLSGEATLPDGLSPPPSVRVTQTENGPVTLLSWDAAPKTSSLALQRDLSSHAVSWTFTEN